MTADMQRCGAEDSALVRDPAIPDHEIDETTGHGWRHPTCTLPPHPGRWHQEWRAGQLEAEWGGDARLVPLDQVLLNRLNEALHETGGRIEDMGLMAHGDHVSVTGYLPPDLTAGEPLLLFTRVSGAGAARTPSGWTLLERGGQRDGQFAAFARLADGTEFPPTVAFTGGRPGDRSVACIFRAGPR